MKKIFHALLFVLIAVSKQAVWSGTKENDAILVIGHAE